MQWAVLKYFGVVSLFLCIISQVTVLTNVAYLKAAAKLSQGHWSATQSECWSRGFAQLFIIDYKLRSHDIRLQMFQNVWDSIGQVLIMTMHMISQSEIARDVGANVD